MRLFEKIQKVLATILPAKGDEQPCSLRITPLSVPEHPVPPVFDGYRLVDVMSGAAFMKNKPCGQYGQFPDYVYVENPWLIVGRITVRDGDTIAIYVKNKAHRPSEQEGENQ